MKGSLPLVIVGSGGASINAIRSIRGSGYEGALKLYTDANEPPINPMLLTYYLAGKIPLENCYLCNLENFIRDYKVNWEKGSPVVEIDPKQRILSIETSRRIEYQEYQACLVSTGASAIIPSLHGFKGNRVFTLRKLEDVKKLRKYYLEKPKKVLIVGASMVGIKLVEIFQEVGSQVYLADLASQVFPLAAHLECSGIIEDQLEKKGIKLFLNQKVEYLEESRQGVKVGLSSFEDAFDIVVFCIGVKSNFDFLRSTEVQRDKGILVDQYMSTNIKNLYAAGDVAQGTNLLTQKKEVIALWANACEQGRIAGSNMAGVRAIYPGSIPQNITHFFNMFFVSIGEVQDYEEFDRTLENNSLTYIFRRKGKVVGYNLLTWGNSQLINSVGTYRYSLLKALINP